MKTILLWLALLLPVATQTTAAWAESQVSVAQERMSGRMDFDTFTIGDSCGLLAKLAPAALNRLLDALESSDAETLGKFCRPEEELSCLEYEEAFAGEYGFIRPSADGYCSFVPLGAN